MSSTDHRASWRYDPWQPVRYWGIDPQAFLYTRIQVFQGLQLLNGDLAVVCERVSNLAGQLGQLLGTRE